MAEIIRMPRLSDTMEEGVIVGWEKAVGDTIEPGDLLAEIETDKATMEFESPFEGVLLHIEVEKGAVPINGIIAVIGEEGEDFEEELEEARKSNGEKEDKDEESAPEEDDSDKKPAQPESTSDTTKDSSSDSADTSGRIKASPLARSMASESGIDLSGVKGSGDNGRIVKRDIESILEKRAEAPAEKAPAAAKRPADSEDLGIPAFTLTDSGEAYEDIEISQMRKTIARRLRESKFNAPHFYLTVEINMGEAIETRKKLNEIAPVKISFNDIIVKAAALALRHHPAVNSSWMEDKIRRHKNIHIGVAVAVDEGLLVPVIRYADMKSLSQLNTEVKTLAEKARNRKLQPEEMQGNTFTISNLGMFGIEEFTGIINPPDSCILAVGGIMEKAIVEDGELTVGNMMKVTLSCDHRIVDGATGAKFLQTFKESLEDPIRLLV